MRPPVSYRGKLVVLILFFLLLAPLTGCGDAAPSGLSPGSEGTEGQNGAIEQEETAAVPAEENEDTDAAVERQVAAVLEEIGGLAYDEAYQFVLEDGRYVLLIAGGPLESLEEVAAFYPRINLPERVGAFRFRSFSAWEIVREDIWVGGDEPFYQIIHLLSGRETSEELPLNEIFPRPLFAYFFYAIYENDLGEQILLTVLRDNHSNWCEASRRCTIYAGLHFYEVGGYTQVLYISETLGIAVTLDMLAGADQQEGAGDWRGYHFTSASFDELLALAEQLDLPGLTVQYQWQLDSWEEKNIGWFSSMCWV